MNQRVHTKPKKVVEARTLELEFSLHDVPTLSTRWRELKSEGWQLFVVDQRRGYCHYHKKWIVIPAWCIPKGKGYWVYYVAHEFAHSKPETFKGVVDSHGAQFMEELKRLCPPEYLHHELGYKQNQAIQAGITMEHAHKAKSVKVQDLWDILGGDDESN